METCWGKTEVEEWNSVGGTVCGISGTVLVEQWNSDGTTV